MKQRVNGPTTINSSSLGKKVQKAGIQPLAPAVFNKNKNSALCLPLLSETQKIIWVHSDEIKIPAEKAAKLDEAFTRFPYLTQKQTLTLAQQCSLHPFLVKSWFMAQRLLYGISWDSKDIHQIRRTMLGGGTSKTEQWHGRQTPGTSKETTESDQGFFPPTKKKRLKKRYPLPRCTPQQLSLMKTEFIKAQYPTGKQYMELSSLSGIPRNVLVQWFNDMRYVIKKVKPRWMTVEQHKTAVASVKREQCIRRKMQMKSD